MANTVNNFENATYKMRRNLEVENAKQQLELLRRYNTAQNDDERREAIQMMDEDLLDIFIAKQATPVNIIPKLEMAIEKDKFRPRNQSLIWFALNPDLAYIDGDISTFTRGRKVTPKTDRDTLRTVLGQTLSNTKNVSKQYTHDVIHILGQLPADIIQAALDGNNYAYEALLATIAQDLNKIHGDNNSFVRLDAELVPGDGPKKTTAGELVGYTNKKTGAKKKKIIIYPDNIKYLLNKKSKKFATASPTEKQQMIFAEIFATFTHEFGHFIDITNPNRGALGAQTSHVGEEIYDDTTATKYFSNPTEVSSHKIEDITRPAIDRWLQQNKFHE